MSQSQKTQILQALRAGRALDPLVALREFRCFRLASRISELRAAGHRIDVRMVKDGDTRHAEYRLRAQGGR